ncbi:hypothetical protein VCJ71_00635 [Alteriqipengyuania sp. WL0013]|uniref:hypothetical protein n=1 Tax=Alteriqipengyuania sp. WL0013 TaxID=3110773 RepID=UPI002BAC4152|nr:hypothetical protein [Alteriqipengyuania sp. WL0013]MEB3414561.1 hypothetical protein [Alteriqipengyuania sp. WL0013]
MKRALTFAFTSVAVAGLVANPALAEKADQLVDINGELGRNAESMLQSRGFAHISSDRNTMGYIYSYWWDDADDDCVRIEVYDGRVESIVDASDQDCGKHRGDGAAVAVGVAAGAAILGALLTHKSHHHDDGAHHDNDADEAQYERGFVDGVHNAAYHNYDRSDAYANGYRAGVDQRTANLDHHRGRGGYAQTAQIDDLANARAAGGMSELERRGFRQVDNFTSGNTRYSIQWQPETRQCVQVTIADGRFYDIRDIGTHPQCR